MLPYERSVDVVDVAAHALDFPAVGGHDAHHVVAVKENENLLGDQRYLSVHLPHEADVSDGAVVNDLGLAGEDSLI
jgi:hypothetical protein